MLQRAIDLAYQDNQITDQFFRLNDDEALHFLSEQTNSRSSILINDATNRRFYDQVLTWSDTTPLPNKAHQTYFDHWRGRGILADELCSALHLDQKDICAFVGVSRGPKSITLPFWNEDQGFTPHPFESVETSYQVRIYLNPKLHDKSPQVVQLARQLLQTGK